MSGLTTATANKLVDHVNATAAMTEPTAPLKVRLYTTVGTAAASGTEVVGGSYTPQTVTFTAAAAGVATNTAAVVFTGMPADTIVAAEIWDSSGSPQRLWWGPLTANKTLSAGDTFQFDIGALSVSVV